MNMVFYRKSCTQFTYMTNEECTSLNTVITRKSLEARNAPQMPIVYKRQNL